MTRFARAKGSKASNEKTPEDSTPWEVMKEQLSKSKQDAEEAKKREEAERKRQENYETFLNEQKLQKKNSTWCDFPEAPTNLKRKNYESSKKKKNKEVDSLKHNAKKTKSSKDGGRNNDAQVEDNSSKKDKKKKIDKKEDNINVPVENDGNDEEKELIGYQRMKGADKWPNKNDTAQKKLNLQIHEINSNKKTKNQKKAEKWKPTRRKNFNDDSLNIIINGKEVELVHYDGFPVMKKDAERLDELKRNMISKGIPRSEVDRTMKLERRKAEKALTRVKRDVCYNCRKGGHVLSDCPDLKSDIPSSDNKADGVCFKCGSTEHRQFECKVQHQEEFKFASCFICKEQGHIARQCPDNPKGLYPNGGGCKHCGDVTHLKKDCPTLTQKKETTSVRLGTLSGYNDNLEELVEPSAAPAAVSATSTKTPKHVKF